MLGRAGGQRVLNEDLGMDGGAGPQNWMEFRVLVGEWPHGEEDRERRNGVGRGTELGDPGPREPMSHDRFGRDTWVSRKPIKRHVGILPSWEMGPEGLLLCCVCVFRPPGPGPRGLPARRPGGSGLDSWCHPGPSSQPVTTTQVLLLLSCSQEKAEREIRGWREAETES